MRRLTVKRLEMLGYGVMQAQDGASALLILADRSDIDLMFSDIVMPGGMSGIELANEVRDMHPDVRVLLASGYTAEAFDAQHIAKILKKPYTLSALAESLREALD